MGCDIHIVVQTRQDYDSPWQTVDRTTYTDKYCKGRLEGMIGRNYDLFAQLANVRNGHGFAGCDTGDGFRPISLPRGLPADFVPPPESETYMGDHSFSWLTLAELQAYDLNQMTVCRGIISRAEFERWDGREPDSWCGGISGPNVSVVSMAEARAGGKGGTHVRVSWPVTYREAAPQFWTAGLDYLASLGTPHNVRIVFGFDS